MTKSWAGGIKGRRVIDKFIETIINVIADDGLIYLLLSQENQPDEVIEILEKVNIKLDEIVIKRKCLNEHLIVLRFRKKKSQQLTQSIEKLKIS